jgi:small subunit ribosomal protein S2
MSAELKDEVAGGELKEENAVLSVSLSPEETEEYKQMIALGVLFGRKKSKTQPKMNKFIFAYSKGVAVFDAGQTLAMLNKATVFLKDIFDKKLPILVVGTQPVAKQLVKSFANKYGFAYVTERWLGGTLTNFQTLYKSVEYFKRLKTDKAMGKLEKYTKKERLIKDRLAEKMAVNFTGVENLNQLPAVVIVFDAHAHHTAVHEAELLKIPIVAVISNDNNPEGIAYPIPANDNLQSSLSWIIAKIEKALDNKA